MGDWISVKGADQATPEDKNDTRLLFVTQGIDIPHRIINLEQQQVDETLAQKTIKQLLFLDGINDKPIKILMNLIGGSVYDGMAIYDAIQCCRSEVWIIVMGQCFSMGAWILQAAKRRICVKNARIMIHKGYEGARMNHPEIVKRWIEQYGKDEKIWNQLMFERLKLTNKKLTMEKLEEALQFDTIFTPEEAIAFGLADEIVTSFEFLYE